VLPQLLIWVASFPIGQAPPGKPVEAKKEAPADPKVVYIGRGDYEAIDDRLALTLTLSAAGNILGDGKYVADDKMLDKWMGEYCTGYPRVNIVISIREPTKTTIRTMEHAIDRLKKHVPKKTVATFYVSDDS
jgi:hypothetical protein